MEPNKPKCPRCLTYNQPIGFVPAHNSNPAHLTCPIHGSFYPTLKPEIELRECKCGTSINASKGSKKVLCDNCKRKIIDKKYRGKKKENSLRNTGG